MSGGPKDWSRDQMNTRKTTDMLVYIIITHNDSESNISLKKTCSSEPGWIQVKFDVVEVGHLVEDDLFSRKLYTPQVAATLNKIETCTLLISSH